MSDSGGRHPTLTSTLHERVNTLLHKHLHMHGNTYLKCTHIGHCVLGMPVGFGTHVGGLLLGEERWVLLKGGPLLLGLLLVTFLIFGG